MAGRDLFADQNFLADRDGPDSVGGVSVGGVSPQPNPSYRPLADRLRPQCLADLVGQDHLLGENAPLRLMQTRQQLSSLIFWGPPGCGKTTLARLLASEFTANGKKMAFDSVSAIYTGVAELRKIFELARARRAGGRAGGQQTLLFIDEIHRFNRAQQDGFLPYVEDGTIILVGATTENPSFELNAALLSRATVLVLKRLDEAALLSLKSRAEIEIGHELPLTQDAVGLLLTLADGDGRYLLNMIEQLQSLPPDAPLSSENLLKLAQRRAPIYDKNRDEHYNLISALHKSLRGSDPDAAIYWLARMLVGGDDPLYVARRLTRFASEDVGLADPQALPLALAAWDAYERLGSPEGELALANLVLYLATAPKSNAAYTALKAANAAAQRTGSLMPPLHIVNAPTRLMKDLNYGRDYQYDHDTPHGFSGQNYFPDGMAREAFYQPVERGFEREIIKRLDYWQKLRGDVVPPR
ncbi:MAG: replication-associated recombination protein A [Candidatus Symbiobacter sp.]|nr:replication-associated recombination protein A [Candidatus Symbiobacter sp.]